VLSIPLYGKILSNIYKAIFQFDEIEVKDINSEVLIVYTHKRSKREDYFEIIESLCEILKETSLALVVTIPKRSIQDKVRLFKHFISSLGLIRTLEGGIAQKCYKILLIARVKVNIDQVSQFLDKAEFKVLVTFCDAYDLDNILTQYARKIGKTTVTLQHGQYSLSKVDIPENMALNNLASDYLCAWGHATHSEFSKVNNHITTILPLGPLRFLNERIEPFSEQNICSSESKQIICVMLNADNCLRINLKMIELATHHCKQTLTKYCVRFHPKNNNARYLPHFGSEYVGEYNDSKASVIRFSIIYTSGVMIELLMRGELFFLFQNDETPELFRRDLLGFSTVSELTERVSSLFSNKEVSATKLNALRDYFVNTTNVKKGYYDFFKNDLLADE
jgi:hypothetical protein